MVQRFKAIVGTEHCFVLKKNRQNEKYLSRKWREQKIKEN